jgi:hypothetical protein
VYTPIKNDGITRSRHHTFVYQVTLEQANYFTRFQVQVYIVEHRAGGQAGHGAHGAQQRIQETGADRSANVADRDGEAGRDALQGRVVT